MNSQTETPAIDAGTAVSALFDKLQGWLNGLFAMLPNLLVALVLVLAAVALSRVVAMVVHSTMNRATGYTTLNNLAATVARGVVIAIGTFAALGVLGLDKTVTSLLAGAGVIGLALAFAFQDIAGNFMSGILLAVRRPFGVRDLIETNGYFGTVEEVNLRSTLLRMPQGQLVDIPNSSVLQNPIKNFSSLASRRIDLACGVAYGDDLDLAEQVALGSLESLDFVDRKQPVDFYYTEFADSSINFSLRFWIDFSRQKDYLKAQSEAIKGLKVAFDQAGLTIPFPIRTLDFGVVGGVKLDEILPQKLYSGQKNGN